MDPDKSASSSAAKSSPHHDYRLLLAGLPVVLVLSVTALKKTNEWLDVYIPASRIFVTGGDIYRHGTSYAYPPFAALLAAPFMLLDNLAARLVFYALNVGAILVLAATAWRLSGGGDLRIGERADRREWAIAGLGLVGIAPYAVNTLAHGQTDLIIDALATGGCYLVWRRRALPGSALIGLAAAFKGPPLLFAAYFLARRRWAEAAIVAAVAIGLNLIPDLLRSPPGGGLWLGQWIHAYVAPSQSLGAPLGTWASALIYNQSLAGTLQRWVNTHLTPSAHGFEFVANATQAAAAPLKAIAYGTLGLLLALTLATAWRRAPDGPGDPPDRPGSLPLEFGGVLALMLLMSPMSGLAHFPALALATLCVARLAIDGRTWAARAAIGLAAVAALAANKDLVGSAGYDMVLWSGVVTLAAAALWSVCVSEVWRRGQRLNRHSDNLA